MPETRTGEELDVLGIVDGFRYDPVAMTTFAVGMTVLAVGTALVAIAIRRSALMRPAAGVPLALGFVLFLPQFFTPPAVRIGHGALMLVGCALVTHQPWGQERATEP